MWWLIGSAADFWDRGPGFESGFPYYDPDALPDHCVIMQQNLMGSERKPMPKEKDFFMPGSGQWMWIRRKDEVQPDQFRQYSRTKNNLAVAVLYIVFNVKSCARMIHKIIKISPHVTVMYNV